MKVTSPSTTKHQRFFGEALRVKAELAADGSSWVMLFKRGKAYGAANLKQLGGTFTASEEVMREFVANWKAAGAPALRCTIHHPNPDAKGQDRLVENMAAGWILGGDEGGEMDVRDDGLWAKTAWTDDTRELIKADKLRFVSPEWTNTHEDLRTGKRGWWIYGAALTNEPFFHDMPRVAASTTEQTTMDRNLLIAALGLSTNATDAEILAAAAKRTGAPEQPPAGLDKLTAALETNNKLLAAQAEANKALASKVAELEAHKAAAQVSTLEEDLVKAGKLTPAQRETRIVGSFVAAVGFEKAKEHFDKLPVVVQMGVVGHGAANTSKPESITASTAAEAAEKLVAMIDELETKEKLAPGVAEKRIAASHPNLWRLGNSLQRQMDARE